MAGADKVGCSFLNNKAKQSKALISA